MSKVKFLCGVNHLAELYPPVPSGKMMPEWLKNAPAHLPFRDMNNMEIGTIKACPGVMDIVSQGYIVPAWTDILVDRVVDQAGDSTTVNVGWNQEKVGHFSPEQMVFKPRGGESAYSMKIDSPWLIETDPGYSVIMLPLPYTEDHRFVSSSGIIDSDILHQVNFIFTIPEPGRFLIEAGTPLFQMIPFKREKFELEVSTNKEEHNYKFDLGKGAIEGGTRLAPGAYRKYRAKHRRESNNG